MKWNKRVGNSEIGGIQSAVINRQSEDTNQLVRYM